VESNVPGNGDGDVGCDAGGTTTVAGEERLVGKRNVGAEQEGGEVSPPGG